MRRAVLYLPPGPVPGEVIKHLAGHCHARRYQLVGVCHDLRAVEQLSAARAFDVLIMITPGPTPWEYADDG